MLVLNLMGGPGAGKSTLAAHVFAELKWEGVNCELVTEAAKDWAWEDGRGIFEYGQTYFLGEQYRRLKRLEGQVDVVVTDAPILMSVLYRPEDIPMISDLALSLHRKFTNMNFLVRRVKEYSKVGRLQEESEARSLDSALEGILQKHTIRYKSLPGVRASVPYIVQKLRERIGFGK